MIQSHRYTNKTGACLYANPLEDATILAQLDQGNWLGIFELRDGWYRVLTIQGEGWIKSQDAEERSPFNLHIQWSPGTLISYVCAA